MTLEQLMKDEDLSPEFKEKLQETFNAALEERMCDLKKEMEKEPEDEEPLEEAPEDGVAAEPASGSGKFDGQLSDEEIDAIIDVIPQSVLNDFRAESDTGRPVTKQALKMSIKKAVQRLGTNSLFRPFLGLFQYLASVLSTPAGASVVRRLTDPSKEVEMTNPEETLQDAVQEFQESMIQNVDKYLSYVAEQFVEQNKLPIEQGIKMELLESFMHGLRNLFLEHNVEVPEDSVSLIEKMNEKIEVLNKRLNEAYEEKVQLKRLLNEEKQKTLKEQVENAFLKNTSNLPATTIEKLRKLMESVEYSSVDEFVKKLNVMKEAVESKKTLVKEEKQPNRNENALAEGLDPRVAELLKRIEKSEKTK